MSNVNLSGGIISGISGTMNSVEFISGSTIDLSAANIIFAPNQLTGDYNRWWNNTWNNNFKIIRCYGL